MGAFAARTIIQQDPVKNGTYVELTKFIHVNRANITLRRMLNNVSALFIRSYFMFK